VLEHELGALETRGEPLADGLVGHARPGEPDERLRLGQDEVAQRSASEMGIEILNATVGGALDVYPRVDIRDVLAVVE